VDLSITSNLGAIVYWVTLVAVAVSAVSGVLEAGKKRFDLFGMMIIAIATALGGGSLRDLLLDRPVFWIHNPVYLWVAIAAAVLSFGIARWFAFSSRVFLLPDAVGLATFTLAGTLVALALETPWLVASFMGVITGVMGGVFRDVLCNEEPLVFQGTLYATAAWLGALIFIGLLQLGVATTVAVIVSGVFIFLLRVLAMYFNLGLPKFRFNK
jgi:uncharacterized membrane protein YeiH